MTFKLSPQNLGENKSTPELLWVFLSKSAFPQIISCLVLVLYRINSDKEIAGFLRFCHEHGFLHYLSCKIANKRKIITSLDLIYFQNKFFTAKTSNQSFYYQRNYKFIFRASCIIFYWLLTENGSQMLCYKLCWKVQCQWHR